MAVDSTPFERFRVAHDLLHRSAEYRIDDVCRLSPAAVGYFDIVMFLGVLYHLKHPMLALEKVCELSTDMVCVESFVIDDGSDPAAKPVMEFYETTELCGQFDNWVGPNTACLLAMCRTAGFARVRLESVLDHRAHVTCYRRWPEIRKSARTRAAIDLAVENAVTRDREFSAAERRLCGHLVQEPARRSDHRRCVPAHRPLRLSSRVSTKYRRRWLAGELQIAARAGVRLAFRHLAHHGQFAGAIPSASASIFPPN